MGAAPSMPSAPHSKAELLGEVPGVFKSSEGALVPGAGSASQQYESLDGNRITVDIRGADLEEDSGYHVFVQRNTPQSDQDKKPGLTQHLTFAGGAVQGVLGIVISLLTVSKIWEEIRFMRSLRRELSALAGSLPGLGSSGLGGGFEPTLNGSPDPAATQGGASSRNSPANSHSQGLARNTAGGAVTASKGNSLLDELNTSVPGLGRAGAGAPAPTGPPQGWASVSGLDHVKQLLQEVTVLPNLRPDLFKGIRQPPRGVLLFGPPGSGKTLLARAVAAESHAAFFAITGSSVLSMWYGQSEANIRALFESARQHQPSVIFIDEVDSLLGKRGGNPGNPGGDGGTTPDRRITNEFLAFIDGIQTERGDTHITVMAATNHPWDLDEAALSRFSRRVYVPLPDKAARAKLLASSMQGIPCDITGPQWLQLADKCAAYSGRDLVALCREASMRPLRELWGQRLLSRDTEVQGCVDQASAQPLHQSEAPLAAQDAAGPAGGGAGAQAAGSDHVARNRVVSLLAGHLHAGRNAKRLRKELSQWRRQQGGSVLSWCDVDALMREAAQRAHSMAIPTGHAEEPGGNCGKCNGGGTTGTGGASGCRAAAAGASGACQTDSLKPGSESGGTGRPGDMARASSTPGPTSRPTSASQTPIAAHASNGSHPQTSTSCGAGAGQEKLQQAGGDSTQPGTQSHTPGSVGDSKSVVQATKAEASDPKTSEHVGERAAAREAGAKAGAPGMTLEQLLSLPADKVRSVCMSDFEAALSQIMPSEEASLTSAFEDFNNKFGSGADVKRSTYAKHAYMHIYT